MCIEEVMRAMLILPSLSFSLLSLPYDQNKKNPPKMRCIIRAGFILYICVTFTKDI